MTAVVYPVDLPAPQVAPIQSSERRLLSADGGLYQARNVQRDRHAIQQITFPPFSPVQAAAFRTWWEDTLVFGGSWFAATWPLPQGWIEGVRRWIAPPTWAFVSSADGGRWRVSAPCEVRGVGLAPQTPEPPPPPSPLVRWLQRGSVNFSDASIYDLVPTVGQAVVNSAVTLNGADTIVFANAAGQEDSVAASSIVGDFCIEGFAYYVGFGGGQQICLFSNRTAGPKGILAFIATSGLLDFTYTIAGGLGQGSSSHAFASGAWKHWMMDRSGTDIAFGYDGTIFQTMPGEGGTVDGGALWGQGAEPNLSGINRGGFRSSNLRVTFGSRYQGSTYVVPTAPLDYFYP